MPYPIRLRGAGSGGEGQLEAADSVHELPGLRFCARDRGEQGADKAAEEKPDRLLLLGDLLYHGPRNDLPDEYAPKEVIAIQESDLFICNGGESEAWVESLVGEDVNILRMMECVETVAESGEGIYAAEDEHDHEHDDGEEELDEHVWTTPGNAAKICYALCDKLCEADPENANEYMLNYEVYNAKLMELDIEIRTTVLNGVRDTLVFADRFPMRYFTREYGLKYYAAYPGCASQTEPSAKTVAFLIDHVREENIPAVLYMEFSNEKMADVICEDTGCKKLPFYSAHSVTAQQFEDGVTYLDLMRMNIETLKEALY